MCDNILISDEDLRWHFINFMPPTGGEGGYFDMTNITNLSFLNDFEEKSFNELTEVHSFIEEREKNDEWAHPFTNELSVVGIPLNSPILTSVLASTLPNLKCTEKQLEEAMDPDMGEMSLLLSTPDKKGTLGTFPMRYTAISSLLERAGLGGRSIRNVECKEAYKALDPEVKAEIISTCLKLYKDNCKVLFRDGKIATVRSSKYEVLPTTRLVNELEDSFSCNFDDFRMLKATVNHEYISIDYILDDLMAESKVSDLLVNTSLECASTKIGMTFTTSDVGNSIAKVTPFILTMDSEGNVINKFHFGNEKGMKHSTGASLDKWSDSIIPQLVPLIMEMTENIDNLAKCKIKNPGGCLRHIAMTVRLPKAIAIKVADTFDSMYTSCTALDVFAMLNEVVIEYERTLANKVVAPSTKLKYEDIVASTVFMDFKEHDYDFDWE